MRIFKDRADAGQKLAQKLRDFARKPNTIVMALPRGGVPVGYQLSRALELPLDVLIVRKLGFPGQPELAMGAVASGGIVVRNPSLEGYLDNYDDAIDEAVSRERVELERREKNYRRNRPALAVQDRTVIVVDDGAATGSTMQAAVRALRKLGASEIVVALPVAAKESCSDLEQEADRVVCLATPEPFFAVGNGYQKFSQTSDEEVVALLSAAHDREAAENE